jgi:outer membrane cobalamin receptor
MMRKSVRVALGVCLLLAVGTTSRATVFGTVQCVVHDPQHRPVAGALVTVRARRADWSRSATTGADGEITITTIPVGDYTLDVELSGFVPARLPITVLSDRTPVLHVQLEVAPVNEAVTVSERSESASAGSMGPTTLVGRGDIADTPGASRTNSVSMITAFVPGSYVTHDQLHVRGGHQVSWLVDGVPVPNTNIASTIGPQFDPKDVDYLEVHRGGYDAEYGDRTYAVFNVVPRTGFERDNDAEIVASAGSYWQTNDQVSAGGHTERFAYYASVSGNRSDLGLQPPIPDVLHDRQTGLGGFGTLLFNVNPTNQLRLVTSVRRDTYQVPNDAEAQAAGVDDVEREADAFVNLSWVRSFGSGALLTISPFYHRNSTRYDGGAADFPISTTDHRVSRCVGVRDSPSGGLWSVFAQDTIRATSWLSLTGGVRQTRFSGSGLSEDATSPRGGLTIRIPSLGWIVRGFYGRFYQAPPLLTASGPVLDFVTSQNLALIPLHGERDEEVQAGVAVPVRGWTVDADVFRTNATDFFDHNSVGNSNVFFPLTIDGARIRGAEVTVRSPRAWKAVQLHLAYSHQVAEGFGGISGGLTDFSAPEGTFPLDHDQRQTLSAGVDGHLGHGVFAAANLYYGSGLPDDGGPARLPGHTTMDVMLGRTFGKELSLSVTALNVTNVRVLIDNSSTFGGSHFNHPREVYAEVRYRFHY